MKRIILFVLTNLLVIVTISIITSLLGVNRYIDATGLNYESLLIFCLIWGMVGSFISLLLSKVMAKWMMGVKIIDPRRSVGVEKELCSRVQNLARKAHIPVPEVGIYTSNEINAFATGASKSSSLVAVSTGLLNSMDEAEVEGVLAHEVAHIANGDMVTMTLIQGVVNAFTMFFARVISYFISTMVKEEMANIVRIITTIVLDIIFSILGSIVVSYFSRAREYRADIGGAKLAGKQNMIAALQKLQRTMSISVPDERGGAIASLKISGKQSGFLALFSTHPPLQDRIANLQRMNIL